MKRIVIWIVALLVVVSIGVGCEHEQDGIVSGTDVYVPADDGSDGGIIFQGETDSGDD